MGRRRFATRGLAPPAGRDPAGSEAGRRCVVARRRSAGRAALAGGIGVALLLLVATPLHGQTGEPLPDVDAVLDHLDDLYRSSSSHARMNMTVVRERGTRDLSLESWSRGTDEALIVIRAPAREAGTATLRTDEGLWNYAPRADRLIRIPSGLLSESWMGSHFTNDDLLRETSYREDYRAALSWTGRDGTDYLQVTLTPRPDAPVVYTELRFLLTPDDWIPVRWEYVDEGEVVRVMTFDRRAEVAGRILPMRMVIRPSDRPEERTEIVYQELELEVDLDPGLFSRQGLRRVARN